VACLEKTQSREKNQRLDRRIKKSPSRKWGQTGRKDIFHQEVPDGGRLQLSGN